MAIMDEYRRNSTDIGGNIKAFITFSIKKAGYAI
jgi:hypothetical protein